MVGEGWSLFRNEPFHKTLILAHGQVLLTLRKPQSLGMKAKSCSRLIDCRGLMEKLLILSDLGNFDCKRKFLSRKTLGDVKGITVSDFRTEGPVKHWKVLKFIIW